MLRDRLVYGIADKRVERLLLTAKNLTLEPLAAAYASCVAEELAYKDGTVLKGEQENMVDTSSKGTKKAHKLKKKSEASKSPDDGRICFRCGDDCHLAPRCKYIKTQCYYCKKKKLVTWLRCVY